MSPSSSLLVAKVALEWVLSYTFSLFPLFPLFPLEIKMVSMLINLITGHKNMYTISVA